MVSTVACVAVHSDQVAVVYDSEHAVFSNRDKFELLPHQYLIAANEDSLNFLNERKLSVRYVLNKTSLKYNCWECNKRKCLLTIAFLGWRSYIRRKGVTFKHGFEGPLILKSPRTKTLFIAIEFDVEDNPISGCVVADNGYLDGPPSKWFSDVLKSDIVLAAIGQKTYEWLRKRVSFPIKEETDVCLKYPCKECYKRECSLVRAYYGWRRQAIQVTSISH